MKELHRAATIFASIYTLIQAILWCLFAIYSIAIYACQVSYPFELNVQTITPSDLLFITYYYGKCRAPPGQQMIEAPSAERTYNWMLAYGVISAIWIPTSVLLLVAVIIKLKGKCGIYMYTPWIVNTTVVIIVDICATIVYAIDISKTLTARDYAEFIKPLIVPVGTDGITVLPAIEMTVYFSRGIILWLINFILLCVVIQGARALRSRLSIRTFIENEIRVKPINEDNSSQWVNLKPDDISLKRLPRLQIADSPPSRSRTPFAPTSPQSPISETPPPPLRSTPITIQVPLTRESSFNGGSSSPVYDVYGKHLGNALPEDVHRHIPTNDAALKSGLSNQVPWTYAQPGELNLRIKQAALQNREPKIPEPDYNKTYFFPANKSSLSFNVSQNPNAHRSSNKAPFSEYSQNKVSILY